MGRRASCTGRSSSLATGQGFSLSVLAPQRLAWCIPERAVGQREQFTHCQAWHHATSAAGEYQQFLIDAACFPGSSGSPVFIFNQGSYSDANFGGNGGGIILGTRLMMIGILFAGHLHTTIGEIQVVPIPTATMPIPVSQIPNNLGICIRASRLLEFAPVLNERIVAKVAKDAAAIS